MSGSTLQSHLTQKAEKGGRGVTNSRSFQMMMAVAQAADPPPEGEGVAGEVVVVL